MKRICALLVVMLILIWPAAAFAAGETDAATMPEPTNTAETPIATASLAPDNENVYDGMDRPYKDGYTPTVKDGTATVVLPLLARGEIKDNTVTVTPNLGDTASSPFMFRNYQKTVRLMDNAVNNGSATVSSYLIRFDLPLASGRKNGVYPVVLDVSAQSGDGSPIQQSFTCFVTVTDGKDPNATEPTPEPEKPSSQPKVIVSSYNVNPSPVVAGGAFTVTVTLKNTSTAKSVQNMTVTASCDSPNISLQDDSGTLYVNKLAKEKTTDIELTYKTDLATPAQRFNIALAINYDNTEGTPLTSAGTVSIQVSQPLRVEMEAPQIPASVNAGDTMPLSLQVMNMGRSKVYNVRCELTAPGLIPTGTAFIGNMEAGTATTGDMDVFVGTKDMTEGYEGEDKYGYTNGKLTLIYEDEEGKEYTKDTEFNTTINPPVIAPASTEPEEEPEKAGQWWVSIVVGTVVIGSLTAFLIIRGKRKVKVNEDI